MFLSYRKWVFSLILIGYTYAVNDTSIYHLLLFYILFVIIVNLGVE